MKSTEIGSNDIPVNSEDNIITDEELEALLSELSCPASAEILDDLNGMEVLKKIETCGRVCYKSEDKISNESCVGFVRDLISRGHESVLEHVSLSVRFITDRAIANEIIRHRIASYSQESTRYVNYNNKSIQFIPPVEFMKESNSTSYTTWGIGCMNAALNYTWLVSKGVRPEIARSLLPLSLKTELIMTANLRAWRHFFKLRTAKSAHPDMRALVIPLLEELKTKVPVVFDDIKVKVIKEERQHEN